MQTWAQILASGQKKLQDAGIAEYNLDAWYLFEHAFRISRMHYFMCSVQSAEQICLMLMRYVFAQSAELNQIVNSVQSVGHQLNH